MRVDPFRIHYEEVTLKGAFHHTPRHVRTALTFLGSGAFPFERLITHQLALEGVAGLLADPPRDYLKAAVVLDGVPRSVREERELGLALAAQHREVDLDAAIPRASASVARLRLDHLRGEDTAAAAWSISIRSR